MHAAVTAPHEDDGPNVFVMRVGGVMQVLREAETRQALGQLELLRRECMAGRKCIASMARKEEEVCCQVRGGGVQ